MAFDVKNIRTIQEIIDEINSLVPVINESSKRVHHFFRASRMLDDVSTQYNEVRDRLTKIGVDVNEASNALDESIKKQQSKFPLNIVALIIHLKELLKIRKTLQGLKSQLENSTLDLTILNTNHENSLRTVNETPASAFDIYDDAVKRYNLRIFQLNLLAGTAYKAYDIDVEKDYPTQLKGISMDNVIKNSLDNSPTLDIIKKNETTETAEENE